MDIKSLPPDFRPGKDHSGYTTLYLTVRGQEFEQQLPELSWVTFELDVGGDICPARGAWCQVGDIVVGVQYQTIEGIEELELAVEPIDEVINGCHLNVYASSELASESVDALLVHTGYSTEDLDAKFAAQYELCFTAQVLLRQDDNTGSSVLPRAVSRGSRRRLR